MYAVLDCTTIPERTVGSFRSVGDAKHYLSTHGVTTYEAVVRFEIVDVDTGTPVRLEVFIQS